MLHSIYCTQMRQRSGHVEMILFKIHSRALEETASLFQATAASHPKEIQLMFLSHLPEALDRKAIILGFGESCCWAFIIVLPNEPQTLWVLIQLTQLHSIITSP